jgi:hypothetical protein
LKTSSFGGAGLTAGPFGAIMLRSVLDDAFHYVASPTSESASLRRRIRRRDRLHGSVLQSIRRRYGLEMRSDSEDLSGRQQILRIAQDDEADFLLAPHAPFLLVGDYHALDYRSMTPVHAYEQIVRDVPG